MCIHIWISPVTSEKKKWNGKSEHVLTCTTAKLGAEHKADDNRNGMISKFELY